MGENALTGVSVPLSDTGWGNTFNSNTFPQMQQWIDVAKSQNGKSGQPYSKKICTKAQATKARKSAANYASLTDTSTLFFSGTVSGDLKRSGSRFERHYQARTSMTLIQDHGDNVAKVSEVITRAGGNALGAGCNGVGVTAPQGFDANLEPVNVNFTE